MNRKVANLRAFASSLIIKTVENSPSGSKWAIENLVAGNVVNEIVVDPETKHFAAIALERMISMTETKRIR